MEGPAGESEAGGREPALAPHQACEQRGTEPVRGRYLARVERLQRQAAVEARRRDSRRDDPSEGGDGHASVMRRPLALAAVVPSIAAAAGIPLRLDRPHPTLTFDDGPHPEGTPAVLDLLDGAAQKAIFFL